MTNKEVVYKLLKVYGCSTSKELANLAYRKFNIQLTPTQVAGAIRPLVSSGRIGSSKDDKGSTRYWVNAGTENWGKTELDNI